MTNGVAVRDRRENHIFAFLDALQKATAQMEASKFRLPIAGQEPDYRERVYTYELYRLLTEALPERFPFVLDPEVDKSGHPILAKRVGGLKPDFVLHRPGSMESNLLVMEVKPAVRRLDSFRKDMNTLHRFLDGGEYFGAAELLYGDVSANDIQPMINDFECGFRGLRGGN